MDTKDSKAFINAQQYGKAKKKIVSPFKSLKQKSKSRSK